TGRGLERGPFLAPPLPVRGLPVPYPGPAGHGALLWRAAVDDVPLRGAPAFPAGAVAATAGPGPDLCPDQPLVGDPHCGRSRPGPELPVPAVRPPPPCKRGLSPRTSGTAPRGRGPDRPPGRGPPFDPDRRLPGPQSLDRPRALSLHSKALVEPRRADGSAPVRAGAHPGRGPRRGRLHGTPAVRG